MARKSNSLDGKDRKVKYCDPKTGECFDTIEEFENWHDSQHVRHDISAMIWGAIFTGLVIGAVIIFLSRLPWWGYLLIGVVAIIIYAFNISWGIYHGREGFRGKQRKRKKGSSRSSKKKGGK